MSWEKVYLKELVTIKNGKDHKALKDGKYPVYGSGGIMRYVEKYLYNKESVLLPRKGTLNNIQYVDVLFWTVDTCYFTEVNTDKVIPYFLFRNLKQFNIETLNTGSAVPSMTFDKYYSIQISLPELDVQQRIIDILKPYDDLIKNNQRQIKLLEEAAQRLYKEWFVDLHFPGYEDVEIVDGVPKGWKQLVLSEIANVVMGQSPKSEFYNNEKKGLPFHQGVTSYGNRFVNDTVYTTSFTRIAEPGSILFSVRAPVGRLNITKNKIVIGRGLSAMNHKKGYQSYLFYLLKERFFKDNLVGNGSIFDSITKSELLSQKFLVPNEEILIRFNDITKNIDAKIAVIDAEINCLVEARDRLLPKLMSGEIEV